MADVSGTGPPKRTPGPALTKTPIVGGKPPRSAAASWPPPRNLTVQGPELVGAVVASQLEPGTLFAGQVT